MKKTKRGGVPRNKDIEQIWVHSDFKKYIKSEASMQGKNIIDFTKEAAHKKLDIVKDDEMNIKIKMRKPKWERIF